MNNNNKDAGKSEDENDTADDDKKPRSGPPPPLSSPFSCFSHFLLVLIRYFSATDAGMLESQLLNITNIASATHFACFSTFCLNW